jgi:hypothetical protein
VELRALEAPFSDARQVAGGAAVAHEECLLFIGGNDD